jgi:hypothetical protein
MAVTNIVSEVEAGEAVMRVRLAQARELMNNVDEAVTEEGDLLVLLKAAVAGRLQAMRKPGESLGDVILRLADNVEGEG